MITSINNKNINDNSVNVEKCWITDKQVITLNVNLNPLINMTLTRNACKR